MIPILYEKDETAFISNGLGRLRDIISCVVSEERNGLYECDFEIAMDSEDFPLIQIGRIIGVTHDDTDDVQPFDIVSYSKPIEGVVAFHCVHISYRQSFLTVNGTNINSLASAFAMLGNATPDNPFSYETDKTSSGYMGAADGVPKTVRSMLGGTEGSILDVYGGEYEWDKFTVHLWESRGQRRDFQIRYGVNMVAYDEDYDISQSYSSCVPYWTDGTTTVVGDRQDSGQATITNRGECVPLDISDKFESQPTKAQVNAMGLSVMNSSNSTLPKQNVHVEFIRLQDAPEYSGFGNLLRCNLCDTIQVIFPDYNSSGWFKIVKTVWNVLRDRYDSMELGDLSMSLSEALGIDNASGGTSTAMYKAIGTTGIDIGFQARNTTNSYVIMFGVGSGGTNHGVFSYVLNKWLIHSDGTDVYVNGIDMSYKTVTATKVGNYYTSGAITALRKCGIVTVKVSALALVKLTARTTVATLPAGFRPPVEVYGYINSTSEAFVIQSNGNVQFNAAAARTVYASTTFVAS